MRRRLIFALTFVVLFCGAASAEAVVIDPTKTSPTPVEYKATEQASYVGVALVPGTRSSLQTVEIPEVTTNGKCNDLIPTDLIRPNMPESGLCWHEGPVMHGNETFALVWDPLRQSFATTKEYVEQFLKNVADGSGTLTSPYAVTSQYTDATGRAANASLYGGACEDLGVHGGTACDLSSTLLPGHEYTAGCTATGINDFYATEPRPEPQPAFREGPNRVCLADSQIKSEIATMVEQTGIIGRTQPGYTPLVVLLTPTGVETCLLATVNRRLCSANGSPAPPPKPTVTTSATGGIVAAGQYEVEITYVTASGETAASTPQKVTTTGSTSTITIESPPAGSGATGWYAYVTELGGNVFARQQASPTSIGSSFTLTAPPTAGPEPKPPATPQFCSYHSQVNVGGTKVDYVVQPWTAMTACDEPEAPEPELHKAFEPRKLETELGEQIVSPLSQSHIAAITDPEFTGWFALDGSEIDDNGCGPLKEGLDNVTVAGKGYLLRREFNNGWLLNSDLYVFRCAPEVALEPKFVVPSPIDQGKVVEFDGSVSPSTLVVPAAGYEWEFGDGVKGVGPSVEHTYAKGGSYPVTLTVTDRGGYVRTTTQTINVLGPNGEVIAPPPASTPAPTSASSGSTVLTSPPATPSLAAVAGPGVASQGFTLTALLIPESRKDLVQHGVALRASANQPADGVASIFISTGEARHAGIHFRRGQSRVVVGRGTIKGVSAGSGSFHLRLSKKVMTRLGRLRHVLLTVQILALDKSGERRMVTITGRY